MYMKPRWSGESPSQSSPGGGTSEYIFFLLWEKKWEAQLTSLRSRWRRNCFKTQMSFESGGNLNTGQKDASTSATWIFCI
jgi:hypothetical protein